MGWIIVLVLIFFVGALFGAHGIVCYSLIKFFSLEGSNLRIYLAIAFFFLSLSFILSSSLAHWKENAFIRLFYLSSNVWLAFLTNFLMMLILIWAIKLGAKSFGLNSDLRFLTILLAIVALGITAWGIRNAFSPQVKNISVKIKNLPESWQGKTAVQISDVHLGHIYRSGFLEKVVIMINDVNPDIVFITGDLFDGIDYREIISSTDSLNDLKAKHVFMVTGNHENYLGAINAKKALENNPKIKILENELVDVDGLKVIGFDYPKGEGFGFHFKEAFKKLKNYNPKDANILLYHEPKNIQEAKDLGVKLQLSGHTHKGQTFPFNLITHLVYNGYDYGLSTLGDYNIYTTNGVGTWGPPMRVGNRSEIVSIKFE